ncbi:helix-turn-helix transcriptional regulator [Citromicrobium bathyomarinum]
MSDDLQLLRRPPVEMIANFVRMQRGFYRWKQQTLASKAGVSLSTVQRVERGDKVTDQSLEKLAIALNQDEGAFTLPRAPISEDKAIVKTIEFFNSFANMRAVEVAPLRTELQIRRLCQSTIYIFDSDLGPEAACDVDCLKEYLDLTSFCRAQDGILLGPKPDRAFSIRRLYGDVLAHVNALEKNYKAVCLAGTYQSETTIPDEGEVEVGVVAVRSREQNPAASKISSLLAPESIDSRDAMRAYFEELD